MGSFFCVVSIIILKFFCILRKKVIFFFHLSNLLRLSKEMAAVRWELGSFKSQETFKDLILRLEKTSSPTVFLDTQH